MLCACLIFQETAKLFSRVAIHLNVYTINSGAYDPGSLRAQQQLVLSLVFSLFLSPLGFCCGTWTSLSLWVGLVAPSGTKPVTPELEGGSLTTGPPRKPLCHFGHSDRYVVVGCGFNLHFPIIEPLSCAYLPSVDPFHSVFLHGFAFFFFYCEGVALCVFFGILIFVWDMTEQLTLSLSLWYLSCFQFGKFLLTYLHAH